MLSKQIFISSKKLEKNQSNFQEKCVFCVTKNQGISLSVENTVRNKKNHMGWDKLTTPQLLGLKIKTIQYNTKKY